MTLVDFLIEQKRRNEKYFLAYRKYAVTIKQLASVLLEDQSLRLLVFGSIVRGEWLPNRSDIDLLIISHKISLKAHWQSSTRSAIFDKLGDHYAPFQIHFATMELFEDWYSRFIREEFVEV